MSLSKLFHILFETKEAILEKTHCEESAITFFAHMKKSSCKCSCCGCNKVQIKESKERTFRGCNLGSKKTCLKITVYKLRCYRCKKKRWVQLSFAIGKLPLTKSFVRHIVQLTGMSTLLHIARLYGLQWKTVKNIDKANLLKRKKQFSFKKLLYISIDEIAIRKGHHYMTIITDVFTGQIIYAVKGRKEQDIAGFLKSLSKRARRLKGVAMDMSASYAASVSKYLPHVAIVFDRFHVTKVINGALDEIRKEEWKNCQEQGLNVVKGQRFLLLRNFQDLQLSEKSIVEKLLEINRPLAIAHTLKEQFRAFWEQDTYQEGAHFLVMWCLEAKLSGIAPLVRAAQTFLKHGRGLLNYFLHKIDNGKAEGINNKIKVLKRQAYGFRDIEYFILKLYNLHKKTHELVG